jgi:hypothetical protein
LWQLSQDSLHNHCFFSEMQFPCYQKLKACENNMCAGLAMEALGQQKGEGGKKGGMEVGGKGKGHGEQWQVPMVGAPPPEAVPAEPAPHHADILPPGWQG